MILQYPYATFNEVKFNDGELMNYVTMNLHFKMIYDNAVYLNKNPGINLASETVTGACILSTPTEIILGQEIDKAITVGDLVTVIDSINQTSSFSASATPNISLTNNTQILYGNFSTNNALSGMETIDFGANTYSELLLFTLNPEITGTINYTNVSGLYYYRVPPLANTLIKDPIDATYILNNTPNRLESNRYAYVIWHDPSIALSGINWMSIGIKK